MQDEIEKLFASGMSGEEVAAYMNAIVIES